MKNILKYSGPGLMVAVSFCDPGNYSTAVAAGSAFKYQLLFTILVSNFLAVFLQVLSAKLGVITGLDLAANCRANLPYRLNMFIYILTEIAIIATDLAEVVGTAIGLNIVFKLPLFAGVVVTVIDVLIVLMAYRPNGPLLFVRLFEGFVSLLVAATVVCFAIELYQVSHDPSINFSTIEVLKGFLPNEQAIDLDEREGGSGLFLSLAILGATVMPHSLYLGSGLVQARLKDFDIKNGFYSPPVENPIQISNNDDPQVNLAKNNQSVTNDNLDGVNAQLLSHDEHSNGPEKSPDSSDSSVDDYRPSIHAINDTMTYTITELVISLFTVALFVNAAILIVAGATLDKSQNHFQFFLRDDDDHDIDDGHNSDSDSSDESYGNADLFTIYHLLSTHLSPTAGFVFALALLCSGQSAGVVCTLAGQMVSEGFLSWSLPPVIRRLITRAFAIIPCLLVVSFAGREGLSRILNASQVVLSLLLPVVSAPLIYFTCSKKIMRVPLLVRDGDEDVDTILDYEDDNSLLTKLNNNARRYKTTEPAIRLQNLRNSHPCVGWEDDDTEDHEQQHLVSSNTDSNDDSASHPKSHKSHPYYSRQRRRGSTVDIANNDGSDADVEDEDILSDTNNADNLDTCDEDYDIYRVKGFKDMSNGPVTSFIAVLVWAFVASLNLFLIGSMIMGYEVPL
ncbi:natural resistance-associated macrophage protein [Hyphopichia burtonii NRRL Y-1933]|uniref:Natural resistance-associated macrophage protein n=1 Tax=Hyphopichia burtonii NRRL Y-1933 TaxID=984485 RepID=A0A1E4RKW5_9ASCO|nr:natural resistance-associated macrophage protein [Hyphopichia burtonii NRRL Y-1933]ODV67725.1 natural resistance-associated macrophage protein [Hyphopichia burtonii NRRL Y-1933]